MAAKNSRRFVIDASIARAAGPEQSASLQAKPCREFLNRVRKLKYLLVLSTELRKEWDKHQQDFARRWRVAMKSRGLIVELSEYHNLELRQLVQEYADNPGAVDVIIKDCHLIEAALLTDKIVSSLDKTVRGHFIKLSYHAPRIGDIVWLNPDSDLDSILTWLNAGAKSEPHLCLNYLPPE